MGRTGENVWWSLILILVLATEAGAAFRLEPVKFEYGDKSVNPWMGGRAYGHYIQNLEVKELPKGVQDVHAGRIALDFVNPILFVVYAKEQGGMPDTVVFDLNGDGNLRNDPKFTEFIEERYYRPVISSSGNEPGEIVYAKEIELPIPNGPTTNRVKVTLRSDGVLVQTNLYLRGKSVLNCEELDTVINWGDGGFTSETRGSVWLDTNRTGYYDPVLRSDSPSQKQEVFSLPLILFQGVVYEGVFDKTRMELNWSRCPQGRLDLKLNTLPKIKSWIGSLVDPENRWSILISSQWEPQIALKAGDTRLEAYLYLKTESGRDFFISFSVNPPLSIRDGETTPLTIEKPSPEITVKQHEGTLILGRVFKTQNGTLGIHDSGWLVIRDMQGQKLAEGRQVSGKIEPEFHWKLPPTLKKGDKLKVSVTWETELFGKMEAEKEIVLEDFTPAPNNTSGNGPAAQQDVTMPEK